MEVDPSLKAVDKFLSVETGLKTADHIKTIADRFQKKGIYQIYIAAFHRLTSYQKSLYKYNLNTSIKDTQVYFIQVKWIKSYNI